MFDSGVICIGGLPGIGSVGKVAADYLATSLECSTIKSFFSHGFPAQVVVMQGITELLHAELKVPKDRKNLYILSGDAQPLDVIEMYSLAGEILESLKAEGVTDVITLAAYIGDAKDKVVGAANDAEMAMKLEKNGIPLLRNGAIGGLNGLLPGLAPIYGMRGLCLLGRTSGSDPVDIKAATYLLEAIVPLLGLQLDISLIESEMEEPRGIDTKEEIDMYYR